MDTSWKRSIDQTLNNTRATLKRLQERHAHYDVAKRRVDEVLGPSSAARAHAPLTGAGTSLHHPSGLPPSGDSYTEGRGVPTAVRHAPSPFARRQEGVGSGLSAPPPPPLPRPSYAGAYSALHAPEASAAVTGHGNSVLLWDTYAFAPSTAKELGDAFRVMKAQLKGLAVELELERTVRADGLRELAAAHDGQLHELHTAVRLLQNENGHLRESLRALESQRAFGSGREAFHGSTFLHYNSSYAGGRRQGPLDEAKSSFLSTQQSGATMLNAGGPTSPGEERVRQRVGELEDKMHRQQRLLDDRNGRVDGVLRELVESKVGAEVERMRSIAREAAREATEDLVRVRLGAVQSMFHDELRAVLEKTGVMEEVSQAAERRLRRYESEWEGKWVSLQDAVAEARQRSSLAEDTAGHLAEVERSVSAETEALRAALSAAQREFQESQLRTTQSTSARLETTRVELLAAMQRQLQEQQAAMRHDGSLVRESDMRRAIEAAIAPLESRLEAVDAAARREREAREDSCRQTSRTLNELVSDGALAKDTIAKLQRQHDTHTAELVKLRTDTDNAAANARAALAAAESATHSAEEASATATQVHVRQADEVEKREAQTRRLSQKLDATAEKLQTVVAETTAVEDRVGELQSGLHALEAAMPRAVQPLTAKVEALHKAVHQSCLPTLDALQESLSDVTARITQLQDARPSQERQWAQQLSDLRKFVEARVKETEGHLRREMDEGQMRVDTQNEALGKKIAAMAKSQQTLATSTVDRADELGSRLAKLEAAATAVQPTPMSKTSEPTDTQAAPLAGTTPAGITEDALAAAVTDIKSWTQQHLHDSEKRAEEQLQREVDALREAQRASHDRLSEQTQHRTADVLAQVKRVEASAKEQNAALQERLTEAEEALQARLTTMQDRTKELIAPTRLVNALLSHEPALEQLASALHGRLGSSEDTLAALAQLRSLVHSLEVNQQRLAAQRAQREEEESAKAADVHSTRDELTDAAPMLTTRLDKLEAALEAGLQQVRKDCRGAQVSATECHARLEEVVPSLQLRLGALEATSKELLNSCAAVSGLVHERVQAAADTWRGEQALAWAPLDARTQRLEIQEIALQQTIDRLRESTEDHTAQAARQQKGLDSIVAQIAGLRTQLETQQQALLQSYLHPMQERLAQVEKKNAPLAGAPQAPEDGATTDGGLAAALAGVAARVTALEGLATDAEGIEEAGLVATADALAGLRDGLQQCIDKASDYLRKDRWAVGIPGDEEGEADPDKGEEGDVGPVGETAGELPRLQALDDLFLFLLGQISGIHNALSTLQQNAVATLELIQQQELDVLAIPPLQDAVRHLSEQVKPIAVAVGLDPTPFSVDDLGAQPGPE